MKLSKLLFSDQLRVPTKWRDMTTPTILSQLGQVRSIDAGFEFYNSILKLIYDNLEERVKVKLDSVGYSQIQLPSVHNKVLISDEATLKKFEEEFFSFGELMLRATSEEYLSSLIQNGALKSYKQLPNKSYSNNPAFRKIRRSEFLMKSKEIRGIVSWSFNASKKELNESLKEYRQVIIDLLDELNIGYSIEGRDNSGFELFSDIDGSLESIAMAYQYRNKFNYFNSTNQKCEGLIATKGIGLQRILGGVFSANKDEFGYNLPKTIKPFQYSIIPTDNKGPIQIFSEEVLKKLSNKGTNIYIDDRLNLSLRERLLFSDFIGVDNKIVIGPREIEQRVIQIKDRKSRNVKTLSIEEI